MRGRRGKTLSYNDTGTFAAFRRAEQELGAAGFAIGAGQRGAPTGLMFGSYLVSKWRNLNAQQRAELHGVIEGDRRDGPLLVTIFDDAPRAAREAVGRMFMGRLHDAYNDNAPSSEANKHSREETSDPANISAI